MKHRELTPHNVLVVGGVIAFAALWLSVVIGVEQFGKEVHLVFVAGTQSQSDDMCDELLRQLRGGAVNLSLMGAPTAISLVLSSVVQGVHWLAHLGAH